MPIVTFQPAGTTATGAVGETVFDVARRNGIAIDTACVGKATCGLCRIRIVSGGEELSPFGAAEEKHLGNVYHLNRVRLSCQCVLVGGDVTVEIRPPRSKQKSRPR